MRRSKAPSSLAKVSFVSPRTNTSSSPSLSTKPTTSVKKEESEKDESNIDRVPTTVDEGEKPVALKEVEKNEEEKEKSVENEKKVVVGEVKAFKTPFKSPLVGKGNLPIGIKKEKENKEEEASIIYMVLWCNYSNKKHKNWNDGMFSSSSYQYIKKYIISNNFVGVLKITGTMCRLLDMDGKELGKTSSYGKKVIQDLVEGNTLQVGGKELEV